MSRLIRDTDIINAIEEWRSGLVCTPSQYADCVVDGTLETVEEVIIDKAPTAYSVEAVVRELETKSTFFAHEAEGDKDMGYEYLTIRKYGISDGLDIAIEIVKQGGQNE